MSSNFQEFTLKEDHELRFEVSRTLFILDLFVLRNMTKFKNMLKLHITRCSNLNFRSVQMKMYYWN